MFHPPLLTVDPAVTPSVLREMARGPRDLGYACVKTAGLATTSYGLRGLLYVSTSGWLMLNVPNALVRGAFDALHEPGAQLPPPGPGKRVLNAHVAVADPAEVRKMGGPDKIAERGHSFPYSLGGLKVVEPSGWPEMSKVWFLEVKSPALQKLRASYGLSPLPRHPFHCTVACRRKRVLGDNDVRKTAEASAKVPRVIPAALTAAGLGGAYALHRWLSRKRDGEGGEKVAAQHHAQVVELKGRDGKAEKVCPHCGKSIEDGEVYTDAKGWTFHRPCFQRGKGSVKLAADPLEEYLAPFDPDEFELPGESLEKEAIDAETVARAWARVQRYGRASRADVLQHRAREAQRAAQAAHAAGDLALARRHGGMAEILNRRAGAAGVREGGLPYAESFAGRLGPSYDSAGAEMRQGWAAGHNQRSRDRLRAMNVGTMDWTPGEGFHRPDTPVDTRLPVNFYRPVTAPDPNSYAAQLLTKEAPVITGEMKPAVRDRIMSAMGAPGRAEAVYRGTGRAHALVDRGVAVAPENVYATLHEMGHLATPPGVEGEMRRLWDTHGAKTPLVRDLGEPAANRAYLDNYDALKKELGGSLPAREKLEAWAHNQEQTYSSLALHRGLAERARAGAGGALAPDSAARLPDWVRGAVDYQGPVQHVGNYSSSWRPAVPGAAGVATPAAPVTTRAPKVVSVPPPPKPTGVEPTPPVSPGNPVMAVSDPAPSVKNDPSYRRMAARALAAGVGATGVSAAGAGLGYYGTTGMVSKGAAAPEQKPGSLQGQGGSLPDRRPAIMNRALADTEVGHARPSRPQSHRPTPADPQGQVRVEPRPAGPEGPEIQRPPAGPGPAPAEGRPA